MSKILRDESGELEFDFSQAIRASYFTELKQYNMSGNNMKEVDFFVEWEHAVWLIEVKNPSCSKIPNSKKAEVISEYTEKLSSGTLINDFGQKLRDSFLYLYWGKHLTPKPMKYWVFIALNEPDDGQLESNKTRLSIKCCIPQEGRWDNHYIDETALFNEKAWNRNFESKCPVKRI